MENITSKRRGRPPKNLGVPNAVEEGEDAPGIDVAGRESSGAGSEPPQDSRPEGSGWLGFVDRVKAKAANSGRGFDRVTYPAPESEIIDADWPIKVEIGPESV